MKRTFKLFLLFGVVAALSAMLVACGGDDDDDDDTAPTAAATAAATSAATAAQPSAAATKAAAYPVTVTDLLGRQVKIEKKPTVVVALSPTAVEFVYAAGATVAGRSASVTYPPEAVSAKEVGTAYQPSFEQILALKPDIIIADSVIHAQPQVKQPLIDLGVPVVFAGADSYQKVIDGLKIMGQVFDATAKTNERVAAIEKAKTDAKAALAGKTYSAVALISDRDQVLYAAKPSSYAGDIMAQLGITNPAASQADSGPFPGYTTVAPEKLIQFDPDFIFTITPAPAPAPKLSTLIPQIPPFKGLKAVTGNKVVEADLELFLQAPGPRADLALKALAAALTKTN
ncbi:hypothetical protein AYO38_08840 [bacterium SCGC AG-212-C10]|nr:hypothetical protein AYO38_08840 [bacterium SCGC AG-212-C10]